MVQDRFRKPEWRPDGTVQVMLDHRAVADTEVGWPRLLAHLQVELLDVAASPGAVTDARLNISNHLPFGERVRVPVTFRHDVLRRLVAPVRDRAAVPSVAVEVGPVHAHVRACSPW